MYRPPTEPRIVIPRHDLSKELMSRIKTRFQLTECNTLNDTRRAPSPVRYIHPSHTPHKPGIPPSAVRARSPLLESTPSECTSWERPIPPPYNRGRGKWDAPEAPRHTTLPRVSFAPYK